MWESLANDPWPVFGVLFAGACLALWWSKRTNSKPAFLIAVGLLLLSLAPLIAGLFVDTPRKQVEKTIYELAAAGENRDHRKITEALDPDYHFGQLTKDKFAQIIERELKNFRPDYVSISNLEIDAKPETATASFRATTGGKLEGQGAGVVVPRYLVRLRLTFAKKIGRWLITEIRRFDPQMETEREIPLNQM
jgi:hypothetical protein